jgi:hypothetical protein
MERYRKKARVLTAIYNSNMFVGLGSLGQG